MKRVQFPRGATATPALTLVGCAQAPQPTADQTATAIPPSSTPKPTEAPPTATPRPDDTPWSTAGNLGSAPLEDVPVLLADGTILVVGIGGETLCGTGTYPPS